jgi:hypothetical protein
MNRSRRLQLFPATAWRAGARTPGRSAAHATVRPQSQALS